MAPSILIADDHSLIRKGLKLFMQFDLNYIDIQEVSTCNELMSELIKKRYTHLILDIILTDGSSLEVIPNIRRVYPDLQILIFSMQPQNIYANALNQYGINRYLSKAAEEPEIIRTLRDFLSNQKTVAPSQSMQGYNPFTSLSARELEILHYLLRGTGTKEISELLNLKMNTVSTVKTRIYEKTNSSNIRELIELASLYNINF